MSADLQEHAGHEQALPERPLRNLEARLDPLSRLSSVLPEPAGADGSHAPEAPEGEQDGRSAVPVLLKSVFLQGDFEPGEHKGRHKKSPAVKKY